MVKRLKVYLPFTANTLKQQLAYKGAFYLFILINLFGAFINYHLWMAIYGSSNQATLGGLTQNEMVIYVFMSYITSSFIMISITNDIGYDIVQGTVAMNLIKPIDYRASLISKAAGTMIYRFLIPGVFIWIGLEFYKVQVLKMMPATVPQILLYLLSCIMSFFIYVLFDFCFGMIVFFTTYIFGIQMIKQAIMGFLTGQLIPISFFPEVLRRIFDYLPFSSMVYTPVMIYLGKYSEEVLWFMLLRQAIWVVLLYVLGSLVWKQVTKRLVILGG